jgi:hypothetical protein
VDEQTHNVTPVNCFAARKLKTFPGPADFNVAAWLTDGLGEMPVEVIVEKLDTLDEVYRRASRVRFDDPLKEKYLLVRIRECVFPVAGQYVQSLNIGGELIAHRKFRVHS